MDGYVLGIDGGGTKTTVCAADLQGNILTVFKTGAININGESAENVRKNLHGIFSEASLKVGALSFIKSVCIGAAGISNADARLFLENTVRETGYAGKLIIAGDHQTALYGALGSPEGIILIAGTGSICYGRNNSGKEHRTGGYGYLIDDEGSGYAIGRDILKAMVRSHDGREDKTILTSMVFEQLGVSTIEEVIGFLYHKNTNKRDVAALAPILTRALAEGDEAAQKIALKCCDELVKLVSPVVERLGLEDCSLAMAGSILQKDEFIGKGFIDAIQQKHPRVVCVTPKNDAAYGAVLMALRNGL
ncbi:BadF/BadG/BcrA/BcrD ATPase family protein [Pseudoclostridium thermosuccinogenes]|jgi:N-acetylglucosamine kinase-like BadF-type ATPase|uniref:N-acetylglucosamine kinase n=1 Tax=Clostridium thermosuccinogenes TaxID=84032 RepID=UPI002FD9BF5A